MCQSELHNALHISGFFTLNSSILNGFLISPIQLLYRSSISKNDVASFSIDGPCIHS